MSGTRLRYPGFGLSRTNVAALKYQASMQNLKKGHLRNNFENFSFLLEMFNQKNIFLNCPTEPRSPRVLLQQLRKLWRRLWSWSWKLLQSWHLSRSDLGSYSCCSCHCCFCSVSNYHHGRQEEEETWGWGWWGGFIRWVNQGNQGGLITTGSKFIKLILIPFQSQMLKCWQEWSCDVTSSVINMIA